MRESQKDKWCSKGVQQGVFGGLRDVIPEWVAKFTGEEDFLNKQQGLDEQGRRENKVVFDLDFTT